MKLRDSRNSGYELIYQIRCINEDIESEYRNFHNQTDSDLLEASIYRIKELKARQRYLFRLARETGTQADYMNFSEVRKDA